MEVYAAQIDRLDHAVGRIVDALDASGTLEDTLLLFLSDNGASDEALPLVELERFKARTDICVRKRAMRARADRQRAVDRARARGHVCELRTRVGDPVEHAVSLLQAMGARGRHRDPADRSLARGRFAAARRHAYALPVDRRGATVLEATGATYPTRANGERSFRSKAAACSWRCAASPSAEGSTIGSAPAMPPLPRNWKLVATILSRGSCMTLHTTGRSSGRRRPASRRRRGPCARLAGLGRSGRRHRVGCNAGYLCRARPPPREAMG